ncbi:Ankyrin repeat protein [Pyrobaculum oguniense TE7]|uniref:Ankyrin repeat protein n=1 Tax=Pyrobaculum oguniense (strain DSM 13380 / JCM 10595 / TE7) TaxID=698757 RepID=H6QCX0_PYROT|nr:Ankyrin repeat protein [Pyrobaculum oguniense TE7]
MNSVLKLKRAIIKNDVEYLEKNPDLIDYAGVLEGKYPPVHLAVRLGRGQIVEMILKRNPALVNWGNWKPEGDGALEYFGVKVPDETPLHVAALYCLPQMAELLLKHGADPNAMNVHGDTPLHVAAFYGCTSVVELLLRHGADPDIDGFEGWKPYDRIKDPHIAYLFLRYGVRDKRLSRLVGGHICRQFKPEYLDVITPDDVVCPSPKLLRGALERNRYDIAAVVAAQLGDAATVERILAERPELAPIAFRHAAAPAVVEVVEKYYKPTAEELQALFDEAVTQGRAQLVAYLLERGVEVSCKHLEITNAQVAEAILSRRKIQCDDLFQKHIENYEMIYVLSRYYTPSANDLCHALHKKSSAAKVLAEYVQSVDTKCICKHLDEDVAIILLRRGLLDPNTRCGDGTLLHEAASWCKRELVKELLSRGADDMAVDEYNRLPVEVACSSVLDLF